MALRDDLLLIAKSKGLEPTDKFDKIIRAKEMMGIGMYCPCDSKNKERYCISTLCRKDVEEKGTCHCGCWKKAKENA